MSAPADRAFGAFRLSVRFYGVRERKKSGGFYDQPTRASFPGHSASPLSVPDFVLSPVSIYRSDRNLKK